MHLTELQPHRASKLAKPHKKRTQIWEKNAISYEAIDILRNNSENSEYYRKSPGIIRRYLEWETK